MKKLKWLKKVETTFKEKERQQQKIPLNKTENQKAISIMKFDFSCCCVWLFSNFLLESVKAQKKNVNRKIYFFLDLWNFWSKVGKENKPLI